MTYQTNLPRPGVPVLPANLSDSHYRSIRLRGLLVALQQLILDTGPNGGPSIAIAEVACEEAVALERELQGLAGAIRAQGGAA